MPRCVRQLRDANLLDAGHGPAGRRRHAEGILRPGQAIRHQPQLRGQRRLPESQEEGQYQLDPAAAHEPAAEPGHPEDQPGVPGAVAGLLPGELVRGFPRDHRPGVFPQNGQERDGEGEEQLQEPVPVLRKDGEDADGGRDDPVQVQVLLVLQGQVQDLHTSGYAVCVRVKRKKMGF